MNSEHFLLGAMRSTLLVLGLVIAGVNLNAAPITLDFEEFSDGIILTTRHSCVNMVSYHGEPKRIEFTKCPINLGDHATISHNFVGASSTGTIPQALSILAIFLALVLTGYSDYRKMVGLRLRYLLTASAKLSVFLLFLSTFPILADDVVVDTTTPLVSSWSGFIIGASTVGGVTVNIAEGPPFTPAANYILTTISVVVARYVPPNQMRLTLAEDAGGVPGQSLETFTLTGSAGVGPPMPTVLTSSAHPLLLAHKQYWLIASASLPTTMFWALNNTSIGTVAYQYNGGPWALDTRVNQEQFRVTGIPVASNSPPTPTISYYVQTTNPATLASMGRDLARSQIAETSDQDGIVALLFGQPIVTSSGEYGAGFNTALTVSQIAELVEAFASGYYNALGTNTTIHVRVAISTSNATTQCHDNNVTFNHGQAWAQMVNSVASWVINQGYSGQIDIAGGSDIELALASDTFGSKAACNAAGKPRWGTVADAKNWVDGYSSVSPQHFLYDLGDAGGCPEQRSTASPGPCNAGATQDDVWYVSWGKDPSQPLPQIYVPAQAAQWQQLSLYGYLAYGANIVIAGALTEAGACGSSCQTYAPAQGWMQLDNQLNSDTRTAQTLPWSTDIRRSPN